MDRKQRIIAELSARRSHQDPHARQIAAALISHHNSHPDSWVKRAIDSEAISRYISPLEQALILEKIVLHHLFNPYWEQVLSTSSRSAAPLNGLAQKLDLYSKSGWLTAVDEISFFEAESLLGQPIKTHRLSRYEQVLSQVIAPLIDSIPVSLTILDAGASAGAGAHTAKYLNLPVSKWLAVDLDPPAETLSWILTCSVRVHEMVSGDFQKNLHKFISLPRNAKTIVGDITNLPTKIPSSSVDVYLSLYSYYQLADHKPALAEAFRVTKPGGLIVITDNIASSPFRIVSPGHSEAVLSTWVWVNTRPHPTGPIPVYRWSDTDFKTGRSLQLKKAALLYRSANRHASPRNRNVQL